jgi:hypothetical protein
MQPGSHQGLSLRAGAPANTAKCLGKVIRYVDGGQVRVHALAAQSRNSDPSQVQCCKMRQPGARRHAAATQQHTATHCLAQHDTENPGARQHAAATQQHTATHCLAQHDTESPGARRHAAATQQHTATHCLAQHDTESPGARRHAAATQQHTATHCLTQHDTESPGARRHAAATQHTNTNEHPFLTHDVASHVHKVRRDAGARSKQNQSQ